MNLQVVFSTKGIPFNQFKQRLAVALNFQTVYSEENIREEEFYERRRYVA